MSKKTALISSIEIAEWSEELGFLTPGIYFLLQDDDIVYVGQSRTTILSRLAHHLTDKRFNRVTVLQYPSDYDFDTEEAEYIWQLQPKYNQKIPTKSHQF